MVSTYVFTYLFILDHLQEEKNLSVHFVCPRGQRGTDKSRCKMAG